MSKEQVKVRFAPSPTGELHIGGVRTALFNYLFARSQKGSFLLRIEDTDRERSKPEYEEGIVKNLKWLGLEWDDSVTRQSERFSVYQTLAQKLIDEGKAYPVVENGSKAVKFKIESRKIHFNDMIRGRIEFDTSLFDDLVVMKSDGTPTYSFACVVDDNELGITHVIRGEDHISNTPRQILMYEAFGYKIPHFAHLPLIVGSDSAPLSKRHAAVSLGYYKKEGYLPEGLINYLALLGWGPGTNEEFFTKDGLVNKFSMKRVNKTSATFDEDKLKWVNAQHIKSLEDEEYLEKIIGYLEENNLVDEKISRDDLKRLALLYKDRIKTFKDILVDADYFFKEEIELDRKGVEKHLLHNDSKARLLELYNKLSNMDNFGEAKIEETVRVLATTLGIKAGELIHPLRLVLTGRTVSPGLFQLMNVLGRETSLKRLRYAIDNFDSILKGGS